MTWLFPNYRIIYPHNIKGTSFNKSQTKRARLPNQNSIYLSEPKAHSLHIITTFFAGHSNETCNLQFCDCPAKSGSVKLKLRNFKRKPIAKTQSLMPTESNTQQRKIQSLRIYGQNTHNLYKYNAFGCNIYYIIIAYKDNQHCAEQKSKGYCMDASLLFSDSSLSFLFLSGDFFSLLVPFLLY